MYFEMTKVLAQKYNRIPYPKKLFDHVYDIMVPRGEAKFTLTWRDGRPLSGAMHLIEQGHVFNWLMPSYPEHLEHRPNEALIRSILQWAHANGCTLYNFGGSPPDASDLIRFKEKWGAKKQMYQIYGFEGSSVFIRCAAGLGNMVRRVHRDRLDPRFGEGFNNQGS
jgi:CelD/BcsL family acetyltransferase involved in cellulose biosynthesis